MKRGLIMDNKQFRGKNAAAFIKKQGIYFALIAVVAVFSIAAPMFFQVNNFILILRQSAIMGIMACAMTLVIIGGNFDLSVGSILSFSTVLMIQLFNTVGPVPAMALVLLAGIAFGLISGFLVGYVRLNSMIVTLGMMGIVQALTYFVSGGKNSTLKNADGMWFLSLGRGFIGFIPTVVVICFVCMILFEILLKCTVFGNQLMSVGGNQVASRFSGVDDKKIVLITFILSGMMTALAGILLASRIGSAQNAIGEGYEMNVIAGVILGGASLSGGSGSAVKAVIGILILGVLDNGFVMMSLPYSMQWVANGLIILIVVYIDIRSKRIRTNMKGGKNA